MQNIISIIELQDLEAIAMKYIAHSLGLNIRPRQAHFAKDKGLWKVPLQAIVPRRVTKKDRETKVFIYRLDDIGRILYEKTDETVKLISAPSAGEIEREIAQRFSNLTERIEKEILKEGQANWGKLSWIQTFLRPLYSIVINILSRRRMTIDALEQDHWKYAELLIGEGFIEIDKRRPAYLIPTNELTGIWEGLYRKEMRAHDLFTVAEHVVGKVFANQYDKIKTDLRIYSPTAYVDTTKVYYIDAIRFGENIPMSENEIFFEYQKIGGRQLTSEFSLHAFRTLLSELAAAELLEIKEDYVIGKEKIFNNLMEYRDEVLQGAVEAPSTVGMT